MVDPVQNSYEGEEFWQIIPARWPVRRGPGRRSRNRSRFPAVRLGARARPASRREENWRRRKTRCHRASLQRSLDETEHQLAVFVQMAKLTSESTKTRAET